MMKRLFILFVTAVLAAPASGQAPAAKAVDAGFKALRDGDANTAATAFYEALRRNPKDAVAQFGAGVAAHMLGRDEDAMTSLARPSRSSRAWSRRRSSSAESSFSRVISPRPFTPTSRR